MSEETGKAETPLSDFCGICLQVLESSEDGEDLHYACADCGIRVHRECPQNGREPWRCHPCRVNASSEEMICVLCLKSKGLFWPTSKGQLKRSKKKSRTQASQAWIHASCAVWNPKVLTSFENGSVVAHITDEASEGGPVCSICDWPGGAHNRCWVPGCDQKFHVECNVRNGGLFEFDALEPEDGIEELGGPPHESNSEQEESVVLSRACCKKHRNTKFDKKEYFDYFRNLMQQQQDNTSEAESVQSQTPLTQAQGQSAPPPPPEKKEDEDEESSEPESTDENKWKCTKCTLENEDSLWCLACGARKPRDASRRLAKKRKQSSPKKKKAVKRPQLPTLSDSEPNRKRVKRVPPASPQPDSAATPGPAIPKKRPAIPVEPKGPAPSVSPKPKPKKKILKKPRNSPKKKKPLAPTKPAAVQKKKVSFTQPKKKVIRVKQPKPHLPPLPEKPKKKGPPTITNDLPKEEKLARATKLIKGTKLNRRTKIMSLKKIPSKKVKQESTPPAMEQAPAPGICESYTASMKPCTRKAKYNGLCGTHRKTGKILPPNMKKKPPSRPTSATSPRRNMMQQNDAEAATHCYKVSHSAFSRTFSEINSCLQNDFLGIEAKLFEKFGNLFLLASPPKGISGISIFEFWLSKTMDALRRCPPLSAMALTPPQENMIGILHKMAKTLQRFQKYSVRVPLSQRLEELLHSTSELPNLPKKTKDRLNDVFDMIRNPTSFLISAHPQTQSYMNRDYENEIPIPVYDHPKQKDWKTFIMGPHGERLQKMEDKHDCRIRLVGSPSRPQTYRVVVKARTRKNLAAAEAAVKQLWSAPPTTNPIPKPLTHAPRKRDPRARRRFSQTDPKLLPQDPRLARKPKPTPQTRPPGAEAKKEGAEKLWKQVKDKKTGHFYYWNRQDDSVKWTVPSDYSEASSGENKESDSMGEEDMDMCSASSESDPEEQKTTVPPPTPTTTIQPAQQLEVPQYPPGGGILYNKANLATFPQYWQPQPLPFNIN